MKETATTWEEACRAFGEACGVALDIFFEGMNELGRLLSREPGARLTRLIMLTDEARQARRRDAAIGSAWAFALVTCFACGAGAFVHDEWWAGLIALLVVHVAAIVCGAKWSDYWEARSEGEAAQRELSELLGTERHGGTWR